ncbi:unnamed protein product, partial [marine sediment metagenome]
IAKHNPAALTELLNQPEIKAIATIASPLGNLSDEWIKNKMTVLFDVMVCGLRLAVLQVAAFSGILDRQIRRLRELT